jgi:hypothetical protein
MGFAIASNKKYKPRKPNHFSLEQRDAFFCATLQPDEIEVRHRYLNYKEARKLAKWLLKAADYLESKEK